MNNHKKIKMILFFLLPMTIFAQSHEEFQDEEHVNLDLMVDFAYPVSTMQSVRHDLSQAVYFLQNNDHSSVISLLENACTKFNTRQNIHDDDRDFIQEMINQINALIEKLEDSDRSVIHDLCQQLQDKL